jgi:putative Mg2+ transporter-C (MgtC) family protein
MLIAKLDAPSVIDTLVAIMAAYLLALPLGWERKIRGTAHIGWRTLPLVSVGACAYLLISRDLYEHGIFDEDGPARVLRAMMTGIGFIGGGAILKGEKAVKGITTAASVWTTGAIGASAAYGYYTVAVVLTLTNLFVVDVTRRLARHAGAAHDDAGSDVPPGPPGPPGPPSP